MLDRFRPWLDQNFWLLWVSSLVWVVLWFGLMARSRLKRGQPMFRPAFPGSLFDENWASGGRGVFSARNCAWVSLLPGRFVTGLHFPFNLAFPRRLLGWAGVDNDIPLADLVGVETGGFFGFRLRVTYRTPSGEASFWLSLRQPDALRAAIATARQGV